MMLKLVEKMLGIQNWMYIPSDEDELPLGVEAINEDLFDLNELTEDEDELSIAPSSARASTTYLSTVREVIL